MDIAGIGLDATFATLRCVGHCHIARIAESGKPLGSEEMTGYIAGFRFNVHSSCITVFNPYITGIGADKAAADAKAKTLADAANELLK